MDDMKEKHYKRVKIFGKYMMIGVPYFVISFFLLIILLSDGIQSGLEFAVVVLVGCAVVYFTINMFKSGTRTFVNENTRLGIGDNLDKDISPQMSVSQLKEKLKEFVDEENYEMAGKVKAELDKRDIVNK